jgi:hypothetical protein
MRFSFARWSRSIAPLLLVALLSCSDNTSSPGPEPTPDPVTRETGHATSAVIGPAGGVLQTTANDGTVYTLTIPANDLPTGRTITMTPITAVKGYPLASGVIGGVELKPSGTVFVVPVTLEIETPKTPDAGRIPVAILYSGNATSFEPSFAGTGAGTFTVPMTHFSGGTVGFATAQELADLILRQGATCLSPAIVASNATPPDVAAVHTTFHACFQSDVLPALESASDDVRLATALGKYVMWKDDARLALGATLFDTFDDAAETSQYLDALVGKLQEAITRDNQLCEQNQSLAALADVLFWQTQATRFGLDSVANLLDRATILRDLCAHAVVDSLAVPGGLTVGFPYSLDVQFGLLFNGATESQGVPFRVTVVGDGFDIQHPTGFTNSQGLYTTVITATRDGSVFVTAAGCLVYPGTQTASDVCVDGAGQSEGSDVGGTWTGTVSLGPSPACVIINQNQNAISGTIHQFGGTATLLATLSGNQLLGVTVDGFFAEATCTATGTGSVTGDTLTIDVTLEPDCNNLPVTYTFTRGGTCP